MFGLQFHLHEWNPPIKRQQSCATCGIVRIVECPHEFEQVERKEYEHDFEDCVGILYVLRCVKCGDVVHRSGNV